ncbi:MAG: glycoside hydrolase [Spirochaetaceae bacterium 4572_7]|nr:MAG: glycoside hydrolase [Spirochaetaceae bacterium 4572_7]
MSVLKDSKGLLSFVLHAHLPFVRHPEYEKFLEEQWLFEAISETYLPLLRTFRNMESKGVDFKLTMSFSSTLTEMLIDTILQDRFLEHLKSMIELAEKEVVRTKSNPAENKVALLYQKLHMDNLYDFKTRYNKNITQGFKYFFNKGNLLLITSAATHAFLPNFSEYPEVVRAQIVTAIDSFRRVFSVRPEGIWLPECGYYPGLESILKESGLKFYISSSHGVMYSETLPEKGVFAPVQCSNGVAVFPRERGSGNDVWSPTNGYPGDIVYREFYRDIGFDLPIDYIRPYIQHDDIRVNTGFKYYAITGSEDKKIYDFKKAEKKISEHVDNFLYHRGQTANKVRKIFSDRPVHFTCPYDAELFGHWWFEGPSFLEQLLTKVASGHDFLCCTPLEYLAEYPDNQEIKPNYSSWGENGYSQVWLDGSNDWIYRHLFKVVEKMIELTERYPDATGLKRRALNQAAREVLLSQASDWPFIMKTGTSVPYATKRVKTHIHNFHKIYDSLCENMVKTEWLTKLEKKDNIFKDINYLVFQKM